MEVELELGVVGASRAPACLNLAQIEMQRARFEEWDLKPLSQAAD